MIPQGRKNQCRQKRRRIFAAIFAWGHDERKSKWRWWARTIAAWEWSCSSVYREKHIVLCMYTESCVKEKLQHNNNNNNKVEFVFLCTHGHPFCELVVVPTPPTFAATIWAIRLSKTNSGSFLFFNFTLKPGNDGRRKTTQILLIASTEKNFSW